jgi:hypothetical protein
LRRRPGRGALWLSVFLLAAGLGGSAALVYYLADTGATTPGRPVVPPPPPDLPDPVPPAPEPPKRLRVSGSDGFWVVINPDGSGHLERPDGSRTPLAVKGELGPPPAEAVVRKIERRLMAHGRPAIKKEVGHLIVCDDGVVDVPKDAVITFVGRDKVVTHAADGSSVVYYTDGRVDRRDRSERDAPVSGAVRPGTSRNE